MVSTHTARKDTKKNALFQKKVRFFVKKKIIQAYSLTSFKESIQIHLEEYL